MTKKHYIKLAGLYKELIDRATDGNKPIVNSPKLAEKWGIELTISATMKVLQEENPNFDAERFERACGLR